MAADGRSFGNETQDTEVLLTGLAIEVRGYQDVPTPPPALGCLPQERGSLSTGGGSGQTLEFTLALDPGQAGTTRTLSLAEASQSPVRLRPTELQRYVGELRLTAPGRYELGVEISYDTSSGTSTTVESDSVTIMSLPAEPRLDMVPPDGDQACQSSDFPSEGPQRFLADVTSEAGDEGATVTFDFTDGAPTVRIARVEPPIRQAQSGRELDVAGTSFLLVQMSPAARVDLSGPEPRQTYDGPERISPDLDGIAELALVEDAGTLLTWVIGLDEEHDFSFSNQGRSVQVFLSPAASGSE